MIPVLLLVLKPTKEQVEKANREYEMGMDPEPVPAEQLSRKYVRFYQIDTIERYCHDGKEKLSTITTNGKEYICAMQFEKLVILIDEAHGYKKLEE